MPAITKFYFLHSGVAAPMMVPILFHLLQIHFILCINPHHKIASRSSFKSCRYHNITTRGKLKPPKNLPIVDVRSRSSTIVSVHEMVRTQKGRWVTSAVDTETNLEHLHLESCWLVLVDQMYVYFTFLSLWLLRCSWDKQIITQKQTNLLKNREQDQGLGLVHALRPNASSKKQKNNFFL